MTSTLQSLALGQLLRSFQLTTAALLSATLVALSFINFKHQSFQLSLQQLCFVLAQGGELTQRARSLFRQQPAWTLSSLSFDAWLKHSAPRSCKRSLGTSAFNKRAWRKGTCRRSLTTPPFSRGAWKRRSCTKAFSRRRAWRRTTSSLATWRRTTCRTTFSQLSTTTCTPRTSNLRSPALLSMFLLSLVSSSNFSSNSFSCTRDLELVEPQVLSNAWASNLYSQDLVSAAWCTTELGEQEVENGKAKTFTTSSASAASGFFQQKLQQQEQDKQLAEYLAFSQQLPNHSSQQLTFQKNNFQEKTFNNELAKNLETEKESLEKTFYHQLSEGIPREELTGQSSLLGSLMHKQPFPAFREWRRTSTRRSLSTTASTRQQQELVKTSFYQLAPQQQVLASSFSKAAWFSRG